MMRHRSSRDPRMWAGAVWLRLSIWLLLVSLEAWAALPGSITVSVEHGQPVLGWSNRRGEAFIIETATNLAAAGWQRRLT